MRKRRSVFQKREQKNARARAIQQCQTNDICIPITSYYLPKFLSIFMRFTEVQQIPAEVDLIIRHANGLVEVREQELFLRLDRWRHHLAAQYLCWY